MTRMLEVKVGSSNYSIPEIWLAGFCRSFKATAQEAVAYWHEQAQMERDFNLQQRKAAA